MKKAESFLVASLLFILLCAGSTVWADPDALISYKKVTTGLTVPATYTFRFGLWNASVGGTELWWEKKNISMTTNTLATTLGSVTNPAKRSDILSNVDFSQQYWVQVDKLEADGVTWIPVGARTKFNVVPYAMWSAQGGDILSITAGDGLSSTSATGDIGLSVKAGTGITVDASGVSIAAGGVSSSMLAPGSVTDSKITGLISGSKISSTGLNADTVDGKHSSAFAIAAHNHDAVYVNTSGDTMTGALNVSGPVNLNKGLSGVALRVNNSEALWYDGTYFSWGYGGNLNYFADRVSIGSTLGSSSKQLSVDTTLSTGIYARTTYTNGIGITVTATSGSNAWGVFATGTGRAGYFAGDVEVTGTLSKSAGSFKIDHPLDPANKYLSHSFVESPDMMNIYNGIAILDAKGEAVVKLPGWFEALNRDYRYQLTCVGSFAPVYVAKEIADNQFTIAGGAPGMKVSWQVTGNRQDAYANAHRIPVEEDKPAIERGSYLHPELFGQPQGKRVEWATKPDLMQTLHSE